MMHESYMLLQAHIIILEPFKELSSYIYNFLQKFIS